LHVASWQSLYPALASALALEYLAMAAILTLMYGLSALTIAALMLIIVREQRPLIAMLAACGVERACLVRAIMLVGLTLVTVSGAVGIAGGAGLAYVIDRYRLIPLPDVYYATHLPAEVTLSLVGATFAMIVIVGCIATYIPARRAYQVSCAAVLREKL
jgi:lipoprotein-releasing system permease protein